MTPTAYRAFYAGTCLSMLGGGVMTSYFTLYLLQAQGLSAAELGVVLSAGPVVSILGVVWASRRVDRIDVRHAIIVSNVSFGVCMLVLPCFHGVGWNTAMLGVGFAFMLANLPARARYVAAARQDRVRFRARLRAASLLGSGLGAAGGLALLYAVDHQQLWVAPVVNGLTSLTAAAMYQLRIPRLPAVAAAPNKRRAPVPAHFWFVCITGALALGTAGLLTPALPVIVAGGSLASWTIPLCLAICAIGGGLLPRIREGASTVRYILAGEVLGAGGYAVLLLHCGQVLTLVVGSFVITLGKGLFVGGLWSVSYALHPAHRVAEFEGVEQLTRAVVQVGVPVCAPLAAAAWDTRVWALCAALSLLTASIFVLATAGAFALTHAPTVQRGTREVAR